MRTYNIYFTIVLYYAILYVTAQLIHQFDFTDASNISCYSNNNYPSTTKNHNNQEVPPIMPIVDLGVNVEMNQIR